MHSIPKQRGTILLDTNIVDKRWTVQRRGLKKRADCSLLLQCCIKCRVGQGKQVVLYLHCPIPTALSVRGRSFKLWGLIGKLLLVRCSALTLGVSSPMQKCGSLQRVAGAVIWLERNSKFFTKCLIILRAYKKKFLRDFLRIGIYSSQKVPSFCLPSDWRPI